MGFLIDNLVQVNVFKENSGPIHVGPESTKTIMKSEKDLLITQAKADKEQARMLPNEQVNYPQIER